MQGHDEGEKMLKRVLLLVMILAVLVVQGCKMQGVESGEKPRTILQKTVDMRSGVFVFDDSKKSTSVAEKPVESISAEEAAHICRVVLGEAEEESGFKVAYLYIETIEYGNQSYYVMHVSWLVDDNHWSYIGEVIVSTNGEKIYSGAVDREGNYFLVEKLWEETG